ncbi:hypothetical protein U1Q18_043742 [Sarracenia purpurea var. burkii]
MAHDRISKLGILESTGGTNTRKEAEKLRNSSDSDQIEQAKTCNLPDGAFQQSVFLKPACLNLPLRCRDEISRLTEILNSRVAELANVDSEGKKPNMAEKREGKGVELACEKTRISTEEKQAGLDGARVGTSMHSLQFGVSILSRQPIL